MTNNFKIVPKLEAKGQREYSLKLHIPNIQWMQNISNDIHNMRYASSVPVNFEKMAWNSFAEIEFHRQLYFICIIKIIFRWEELFPVKVSSNKLLQNCKKTLFFILKDYLVFCSFIIQKCLINFFFQNGLHIILRNH